MSCAGRIQCAAAVTAVAVATAVSSGAGTWRSQVLLEEFVEVGLQGRTNGELEVTQLGEPLHETCLPSAHAEPACGALRDEPLLLCVEGVVPPESVEAGLDGVHGGIFGVAQHAQDAARLGSEFFADGLFLLALADQDGAAHGVRINARAFLVAPCELVDVRRLGQGIHHV